MSERRRRAPVPAVMALVALVASGVLAVTVFAATPDEGTVSLDSPRTQWAGESFPAGAAPTPVPPPAPCAVPVCDRYELDVDIDPTHWDTNRGGVIVEIQWPDDADDFDLHVYDGSNMEVASSATGDTNTERVVIENASSADGPYTVQVTPFRVRNSGYDAGAGVETRAIPADGTGGEVPAEPTSDVRCESGTAGPFPCKDVDLEGFLPTSAITPEGDEPANLNDIWGWTDPENGREYAIVGKTNGTSFVDVTDGLNPVYLGDLPSAQRFPLTNDPVETIFNTWRDIKVFDSHAYIVSEEPTHGVQVFDLRQLRGLTGPPDEPWSESAAYSFVAGGPFSLLDPPDPDRTPIPSLDNAHNIEINEESGTAYAIGTSTCGGGGPHMLDLGDPTAASDAGRPPRPTFAGCISDDSYTHDTNCVNYDGPDTEFTGDEICFSSNEDTLTIHKIRDAGAAEVLSPPELLSRTPYEGSAYTHQGWLSEDGRHFFVGDELDEPDLAERTRTLIFDVSDLNGGGMPAAGAMEPAVPAPDDYDGRTESIDHNMYVKGDELFQANYRSGLEVLDISDVEGQGIQPKAFFDVFPEDNAAEFNGAWSNYPWLPSGNIVVSGIEQGLFVVRPRSAGPRPARGGNGSTGSGSAGSGGQVGGSQAGSACFTAATQARQKRLGRAGLGNSRDNVRRTFGAEGRYRRFVDRYCLSDSSTIRVGYPSPKQMRQLVPGERTRLRGKASLVLTSSRQSAVRGINVGDSVAELRRRTGSRRGVRVGGNVWFVRRGERAGHVFKVQRGIVREVGLADRRQTASNARVKRFFTSSR